jgi:hypothetical protein
MNGIKFCKIAAKLQQELGNHPLFKNPKKGQILRIAARWLHANENLEYDLLLRLQVLEGAAGIHVGLWFGKGGRNGLRLARAYFAENPQPEMQPVWLDPRYSQMFGVIEANLAKAIRSYKLNISPREIINNYLMGLSIDPSDTTISVKRPAYAVGQHYMEGIFSGSESPIDLARGPLSMFFTRKVLNEARRTRFETSMPVDEDGQQLEIEDVKNPEGAWSLLNTVIFKNLTDPLGKQIRKLMRLSWSGTSQETLMNLWLDEIESGKPLDQINTKDLAAAAGISAQTFSQRYWPVAWKKFYDALWGNKPMLKLIQKRMSDEGFDWDMEKPQIPDAKNNSPIGILAPRKYASVDTLVNRWLTNR